MENRPYTLYEVPPIRDLKELLNNSGGEYCSKLWIVKSNYFKGNTKDFQHLGFSIASFQ